MWKLLLGCMTPNSIFSESLSVESMEHWCQELTDRRIRYEQLRQDHLRFIFDVGLSPEYEVELTHFTTVSRVPRTSSD